MGATVVSDPVTPHAPRGLLAAEIPFFLRDSFTLKWGIM